MNEFDCVSCSTIYSLKWDKDEQENPPIVCPFCGHEIEYEEDYEDDSWD